MIRRPPRSTRTDTLFPYTTLFRSDEAIGLNRNALAALIGAGPDRGLSITAPSLTSRRSTALPANIPIELVGRNPEVVSARWRVEAAAERIGVRSEEHTSELQSLMRISYAVFCLKKKNKHK